MGVTGLWRLIEPAGKPVPIETLENKVLAVDISIWLHQMVKGYQDAKGAPMPNAHLLGLFQRLCKLLYFRIKPVFVFDGGFPDLKKETIAKRQDNKAKLNSESERLKREILLLLGKKTAIGSLLGKQTSPKKQTRPEDPIDSDDLFKLPEMERQAVSSSESESEEEATTVPVIDLHSVDIESADFKGLPLKEKHDLLIELKETRKMNSWGKLHELPKDSDNFSDFQMTRLLKRRKVQECLEETEKEIGGNAMTLNELESLLNEEGINTNIDSLPTKRIASNDTTRYLLISNVKQALEDAKTLEKEKVKATSSKSEHVGDIQETEVNKEEPTSTNKSHEEFDEDLQKAIQMSLECEDNDTPKQIAKGEESPDSTYMLDSDYSDTSEEEVTNFDFNAAKAYIMQNTDYTSKAIKNIIASKNTAKDKSKPKNRVDEIMKELNLDVSTSSTNNNEIDIDSEPETQTVDLSSSDDECIEINKTNDSVIEVKYSNIQHKIIDLDTTGEDSKFSVNNECGLEEPNLASEVIQSSESDEDFEDVPDEPIKEKPKAVVELNLEMKNTLEDDIFADVFENSTFNVINNENIEQKNEAKEKIQITVSPKKIVDQPTNNEISNTPNAKEMLSESEIETKKSNLTVPNKVADGESKINSVEKSAQEYQGVSDSVSVSDEVSIRDALESPEGKNASSDNKVDNLENKKEKQPREVITTEQLNSMADELQKEQEQLLQEKSRLERMGRNITEQMTRDAQELLQIFGIPYVVAPSEAEAQCAFLESAKLTDGTITDDSDIWLFGGKTVYKNFFNQKKLVMQYLAERIDKSFNLSREQLVLLALLVGSDYTTGVNGVGPVTALEILASFSCSRKDLLLFQAGSNPQARYSALVTGLQEFKKWVRSGRRTDDTSLRKKLRNVSVTDDFPSLRVVQAYMEPKVETSKDQFTWGDLDLTVLRDFTRKKFGWSQNKLDEILNPVLKRVQERKSQRSMQDYFQRKIEFHSLEDQMSKRVKAAVEKMGNSEDNMEKSADYTNVINDEDSMKPPTKVPQKRKPKDSATDIKTKRKVKGKMINSSDKPSDGAEPSTSKLFSNVVAVEDVTSSTFDIKVPKLDRYQEIIPQRELDRMNVLKTKLKAIETYRKTKLNQKGVKTRRVNVPKEKANLSESDSD